MIIYSPLYFSLLKIIMISTTKVNIEEVKVSAYKVPTDNPESDGTLKWDSTTVVLTEISAGDKTGLGYTYNHEAAANLISSKLTEVIKNSDAMNTPLIWNNMHKAVRNIGRPGIASSAISAVDIALWDLKSKILDLPLVVLMGQVRSSMPIYGSGGFTSYTVKELQQQLCGWVEKKINRVKMKIGREPSSDIKRVKAVHDVIGNEAELMVDANGAYDRKQALRFAYEFKNFNVGWFEEPVSSDDLEGLNLLRDKGPTGMEIAAGEYGYDIFYFRRMLEAGSVDVLQADATRCGGFSGFLKAAALCESRSMEISAHTAPAIHLHPACAAIPLRHAEYFHDHVRIEKIFFDGIPDPVDGQLYPDLSRSGIGFELKRTDTKKYLIS
jgi:L-alanine-DL-glutamate epimerase-like enolase superfamily enzyme